jgi:phosphatidylinositol-3-phosphatase
MSKPACRRSRPLMVMAFGLALLTACSSGRNEASSPSGSPLPTRAPTKTPSTGHMGTPTRAPKRTPSPGRDGAPPPLVIIFMENHSASEIVGNSNTPYLNAFANAGTRFTNYTEGDSTGPSLPDYLQVGGGSSCGVTSDAAGAGIFGAAQGCASSVWNQLNTAGVSWGVYEEAMASPCYSGNTYDNMAVGDEYALKHNPATNFASVWANQPMCRAHVLPFTSFNTAALPQISFVTPGICDDMHGGAPFPNCTGTADMIRADTWLATHVPAMLSAGATVFITFDEHGTLYAAERGPGIRVGLDATAFNHYSLLRAIEDRFRLMPLNHAGEFPSLPL